MRVTIRLDDSLAAEAKKHAAESGRPLNALVQDALCEMLARRAIQGKRPPVHLKTVKGNGLHPGIDLDNSAALIDL